jgi:hypothetical protein
MPREISMAALVSFNGWMLVMASFGMGGGLSQG